MIAPNKEEDEEWVNMTSLEHYRHGYVKGVTDTVAMLLKLQVNDVDDDKLEEDMSRYADEILYGDKNIETILAENGFVASNRNSVVSAGDVAMYPSAASGIADFLDSVASIDGDSTEDHWYLTFAGTFEHMVDIFHDDIKGHLSAGGHKVAALIVMTYVTMLVIHKAKMIRTPLTIKGSAMLYEKNSGAIKRILSRLRENNPRIMSSLEGDTEFPHDLGEIVEMLKMISSETSL